MAEALKLKVPVETFKDTLNKLQTTLNELNSQRDRLKTEIDKLNGETFSGSQVMEAKELAADALNRVENGIKKVEAQRKAIDDYLTNTQNTSSGFATDVKKIRDELPDLFA